MRVVSIQIGTPRTVGDPAAEDRMERAFTSAIWKEPVPGAVFAGRLGLRGDAVANTKVHGGVDQAVLMYAGSHYSLWQTELGKAMSPGAFGENLTVEGATEESVCIGDVLEIGGAVFQVTQPRQPCATLARRHQVPDMIAIVRRTGRSGWYLRVLREGEVAAGQGIRLADRPSPAWTVRRAAQVYHARERNPGEALELSACPGLSEGWKARLSQARLPL